MDYSLAIETDETLEQTAYRSYFLRAFAPESSFVRIVNSGSAPVNYRMRLNEAFGSGLPETLRQIAAMSAAYDGEPIQRKVWRFIRDNRYHYDPLTAASWFSSVPVFFNSAGFGYCDDTAAAFYELMSALGYTVRVWVLSGHVVAEVLVDGRWEMWDPDLEVYYLNAAGQVAGVEELAAQPSLITNPISPLSSPALPYRQVIADIYSTRDDNSLCADDPGDSIKRSIFQKHGSRLPDIRHRSDP